MDRNMINEQISLTVLPDGNGGFTPCPSLLTEPEITLFLRIPEVTSSKDSKHVIDNLIRKHNLPCIHICRKRLYPRDAVIAWFDQKINTEITSTRGKL